MSRYCPATNGKHILPGCAQTGAVLLGFDRIDADAGSPVDAKVLTPSQPDTGMRNVGTRGNLPYRLPFRRRHFPNQT